MTEKEFRAKVVRLLRPLAAFPIEPVFGVGTPDVAMTIGWLELKLAKWPMRNDSLIRPKMRQGQRVWHRRWNRAGGVSWVMTMIHGAFAPIGSAPLSMCILHYGNWAAEKYDKSGIDEFLAESIGHWKMPTGPQLINALKDSH